MTTDRIRKKIFERILLVGLFLFPALIPLTYSLGYSLLALSEILYACFLIFSVIALKKNLIPSNFLMNFVAVSSFLFICGVALFVDVIFIYWIYLFPAMIYYILGLKRAVPVNLFFGILVSAVLFSSVYLLQMKWETALVVFLSFGAVSYISSVLEISRSRMEHRLKVLSNTDFLTEILNRRGFEEALHLEVENARRYKTPFCLLFLDIDHFMAIRDNYGKNFSNKILRRFTESVSQELRVTDQFFRTGTDEFAVVLKNTDLAGAKFLSRRILSQIRKLKIKPLDEITTSIGLIQYSEISNVEDLMKRASRMLHKAKHNGKNRIEFQDLKRNLAG